MPVGHAAYVDNKQCLSCHADQATQWQQSHHAKAMAAAGPETVRGALSCCLQPVDAAHY
ncbi:cytochrome c family protein [Paucibacter sp. TC2R-5]|uniref:cytochrome c family protein n=1 Tax=Paucibacter sp. TC2R-5 TaxID=2893555 RepID=UPI0021E40E1E|nr:cytochrome c family protein [Paucibacter sp. TC2R-5]MCV2359328.1 cytochrome c family protein [Paucibacter sp. TC2R-5]